MAGISSAELSEIKEASIRLSEGAGGLPKRFFTGSIKPGAEPRIKVIRGFRGVGKTTALLQLLGGKSVYFSMDSPYVQKHRLYELGRRFALEGFNTLLVDEVHTYGAWKSETKAIYDEFPAVSLVLSGSAPLAFEPERRFDITDALPLSLRELLHLKGERHLQSNDWPDSDSTIAYLAKNPALYAAYSEYMQGGGFPSYLSYSGKTLSSIYYSIRKSIREDAVFFAKVGGEDVVAMEKMLLFLASARLGEFSANSLAGTVGISKNRVYALVSLLEGMGMLRLVRPFGAGAKLVRGDPKLMFAHPNFRSAVCQQLGIAPDEGALREELAVFCLSGRGYKVSTAKGMKKSPDYIITRGRENAVVEIGGEGKGFVQMAGFKFRQILITEKQLIPLAMF